MAPRNRQAQVSGAAAGRKLSRPDTASSGIAPDTVRRRPVPPRPATEGQRPESWKLISLTGQLNPNPTRAARLVSNRRLHARTLRFAVQSIIKVLPSARPSGVRKLMHYHWRQEHPDLPLRGTERRVLADDVAGVSAVTRRRGLARSSPCIRRWQAPSARRRKWWTSDPFPPCYPLLLNQGSTVFTPAQWISPLAAS